MKKRKKLKLFDGILYIVMTLLGIVTLIPVLKVVAEALSDPKYVILGEVGIFPKGFTLETIQFVLGRVEFLNSFKVTVIITIGGTLLAMMLTVLAAYPLSKPGLRGRKFFLYIFVFVMLFHAGMVPNYLLFRSLGLINTIWALIFPSAFSVFNLFIVKNYFEGLPESVEEAAKIDGASNTKTFFTVVLPMSSPVLATVTLFYGVNYWNSYFSGIMYITNPKLKSLQQYLYDLIKMTSATDMSVTDVEALATLSGDAVRSATILVSTLPILILYPYLQKYFVKGITIGSVKC